MSDMGFGTWRRLGLAATIMVLACGNTAFAAQAAHPTARGEAAPAIRQATVTAQNTQGGVGVGVEVDDGKTCGQSRQRLFVEGEGWIVRRVTTCY
jgi:hypothetical protein